MERKYPTECDKHPGNENTYLCKNCDQLLCLECYLDHASTYPDHKALPLSELATNTIMILEKSKAKIGSDTIHQELSGMDKALKEKQIIAENCIIKLRACVEKTFNAFIEEQIAKIKMLTEEGSALSKKVISFSEKAETVSKNVALVKQLFAQKKFDELIKLNATVSNPQPEPVSLASEKDSFSQKVNQLKISQFSDYESKFCSELTFLLNQYSLVFSGCLCCKKLLADKKPEKSCAIHKQTICESCAIPCSFCKQIVCKECILKPCVNNCKIGQRCKQCEIKCSKCKAGFACESCNLVCEKCKLCKSCAKTCETCIRKVCENCHLKCQGKYMFCNGSLTYKVLSSNYRSISTNHPLPKAFKAKIAVKGCTSCCQTIGITGKQFDGCTPHPGNGSGEYAIGVSSGMQWNEYAWRFCNCYLSCGKCLNGTFGYFGSKIENGNLTIILDKNRRLSGELDDAPQGEICGAIPEGDYYLTYGGTNGEITIISIEEII